MDKQPKPVQLDFDSVLELKAFLEERTSTNEEDEDEFKPTLSTIEEWPILIP